MPAYQHVLSAVFQQHADALAAWETLAQQGLSARQMLIEPSASTLPAPAKAARSQHTFDNMLLCGGIGAVAGGVLAVLAVVILVANHAALLSHGLLMTTLALLGSGATMGMTLGAAGGAMMRVNLASGAKSTKPLGRVYAWVHTLLGHQQMQLSVHTFSTAETAIVTKVMQTSANLFRDDRLTSR